MTKVRKPGTKTGSAALSFATDEITQSERPLGTTETAQESIKKNSKDDSEPRTIKTQQERSPRSNFPPEGYKRLTLNVPIDLHKKIKRIAVDRDATVSEIITALIKRMPQD